MDFQDWMLALHLLSAFAVATAMVLYSVLVVSGRRMTTLEQTRALWRVAPIGAPLIGAGMGLAFVFGVILALDSDDFELWDPWVIVGIVLWVLLGAIGRSSGNYYLGVEKVAKEGGPDAERTVLESLRASDRPAPAPRHRRPVPAAAAGHDLQAGGLTHAVRRWTRPNDVDLAVLRPRARRDGPRRRPRDRRRDVGHRLARRERRAAPALHDDAARSWPCRPGSSCGSPPSGRTRRAAGTRSRTTQEPAWIGIGFITAEAGGLLLLIALILGWLGIRRERKGGGSTLLRISGVIAAVLVLVYVIAIWAMGGKPT